MSWSPKSAGSGKAGDGGGGFVVVVVVDGTVSLVGVAPAAVSAHTWARATQNVNMVRRPLIPHQVGILSGELQGRFRLPCRAHRRAAEPGVRITSAAWHLTPGHVLVGPRLAGEAQHPLTEDVLHDVGGPALDRVRLHPQHRL